MKELKRKALFLDRDGIVNTRIVGGYVRTIKECVFIPEILDVWTFAKQNSYLIILISNQQGVGKGLMTMQELEIVTDYLENTITQHAGSGFDDVYYATELHTDPAVQRRKPLPTMLYEAALKWNIDLALSWMIGDSLTDAQAGKAAGCMTILVGDYSRAHAPEADWIVPTVADIPDILFVSTNY